MAPLITYRVIGSLCRSLAACLLVALTALLPAIPDIERPVHGGGARTTRGGARLELTSLPHDLELAAPPDGDDQGHSVNLTLFYRRGAGSRTHAHASPALAGSIFRMPPGASSAGFLLAAVSPLFVTTPFGPVQGRAPPTT